jgi:hypothetical protein
MAKANQQTETTPVEQTRILVTINPKLMPQALTKLQQIEEGLNEKFKSQQIHVVMMETSTGPVEAQLIFGKCSTTIINQIAGTAIQLVAGAL